LRAYPAIKRAVDIAAAILGLAVTGPVLAAAAIAVKATSPGAVFYRARRAGHGGKPFAMLKLRTMVNDADRTGAAITVGGDARVTPIGAFLRRTKIDELPQLINVLMGDMSLVGPRPEDWGIVQRHYTAEQRRLLEVRPGIACPGQIYYYLHQAHEIPPPGTEPERFYVEHQLSAKLAYDLYYVHHASLALDARVIVQTLAAIACTILRRQFPFRLTPAAQFTRRRGQLNGCTKS
jgi:lipopolysaccharide/colanic/teichoic acid biosynthesis glycosyltransferase